MISVEEYIQKSLETNLFFARVMKEHAVFLEASFLFKDFNLMRQADNFKNMFNGILRDTISLSNGVVSPASILSQQFVTNNTLAAEQKFMMATGIPLDLSVTQAEMALTGTTAPVVVPQLRNAVNALNQRAINLTQSLINFKQSIINAVNSCTLFTWTFPLMLEHIRDEAVMYNNVLRRLQNGEHPDELSMIADVAAFWNDIMAEHSLFIQHLLDPTEENLIETATAFANQFKQLTAEAEAANTSNEIEAVKRRSLTATQSLRDFKQQATELILMCQIRSLINPLLADHVTREANHFILLLQEQ